MPRYIKQPEDYACGPTVIINAAKWAGLMITLSDFDDVASLCDYIPSEGTTAGGIDHCLRFVLRNHAIVRKPNCAMMWDIENHLNSNNNACVVCVSDYNIDFDHVFLISGMKGKRFISHNYNMSKNTHILQKRAIEKYLDERNIWFLSRRN